MSRTNFTPERSNAVPKDGELVHEVRGTLTRAVLLSRFWRFSGMGGHVLSERFSFGDDGLVEDYENDNEKSWQLESGVLKVFKRDGDLMWRSVELDWSAEGARRIRLATDIDPGINFYLTEAELRSPAVILPVQPRYTGALRVLILSNSIEIERRLVDFLVNATIFYIDSVDQLDEHPSCNVFISALVLSHADRPELAVAFIERVTKRFAMAIFYELSGHGTDYLRSFGLRSFHLDFPENTGVDSLGIDMIAASAAPCIYKVEHYAETLAFDSFKNWVVSEAHPPATFPSMASRGEYKVFDRPVFEFSIYACYRFDAVDCQLPKGLTLVEMRMLRFRGASSGFQLERFAEPRDLGLLLYNTRRDAPEVLRKLSISVPIFVEDDIQERLLKHDEIRAKWRAESVIEIANLSVYELQNCVVAGTGTIFCKDRFVAGTAYLLMYLYESTLDPIMRGLQNRHPSQHVEGIAVLGFNSLYDNYYHWVAEAMAAISLCIDILDHRQLSRVTLITGKLNRFRRDYINILLQGDPRYQIVELDRTEFVTADTIIYCDNVGRSEHQQVCWEEVTFAQKVIASLGLQTSKSSRMIYVARTDTIGRTMSNEAEIINRLKSMGFEIFVGSHNSVAEQVKTFREARFVVAPHGAGLTNLMFCLPGTVVVEWQQSGYFNTGMMRLAQVGNLRYYSQMFFPSASNDFSSEWEIDVDRAIKLVEKLM